MTLVLRERDQLKAAYKSIGDPNEKAMDPSIKKIPPTVSREYGANYE